MKRGAGCLLLAFFFLSDWAGAGVLPESAEAAFREAEDFKRLSEYFTGREYLGDRVALRTQPEHRTGMYFELDWGEGEQVPEGAGLRVELVHGASSEALSYFFQLPVDEIEADRILLGVTGNDWPASRPSLLAWRISLLDVSGEPMESIQSFAWAVPGDE